MGRRAGRRPAWVYVAIAGGAAATVTLLLMWFLVLDNRDSGEAALPSGSSTAFPSPVDPAASVAPAAPFAQADADRITAALNSGDEAAILAVLVPEFREAFTGAGSEILPAGATVTLLTDRFVAIEPTLGSVPLTVAGEADGNFLLLLSYVDNLWLVLGSEEVQ